MDPGSRQTTLSIAGLTFGRGSGGPGCTRLPWATLLLTLGCVVTTLPMFFSDRFYMILGVGHGEIDVVSLRWWHALVTPFVHGGGFPGTTLHLIINCSLFVFHGGVVERLLGSGRYWLLTGTSLAIQLPLKYLLVDGRAHGASGMTWSYLLFMVVVFVLLWRRRKLGMFKDPVALFSALLLLFSILGLVKHWHLWNLLASIPFTVWWYKTLRRNLERLEGGEPLERGPRWGNALGVALPALWVAFTAAMTLGAVLGLIPATPARPPR